MQIKTVRYCKFDFKISMYIFNSTERGQGNDRVDIIEILVTFEEQIKEDSNVGRNLLSSCMININSIFQINFLCDNKIKIDVV